MSGRTTAGLLDPPAAPAPTAEPKDSGVRSTRTNPLGGWSVASRLARREVRRRPGRTLLVMALVIIPVVAMTIGAVIFRSDLSPQYWDGLFTESDSIIVEAVPDQTSDVPPVDAVPLDLEPAEVRITDARLAEVEATIGDRGEATRTRSVHSGFSAASADFEYFELIEAPSEAGDDVVAGAVELDSGRAPARPDEVLLSRSVAEAFGVTTGDELILDQPSRTWDVVGVARDRGYYARSFALGGHRCQRRACRPTQRAHRRHSGR